MYIIAKRKLRCYKNGTEFLSEDMDKWRIIIQKGGGKWGQTENSDVRIKGLDLCENSNLIKKSYLEKVYLKGQKML